MPDDAPVTSAVEVGEGGGSVGRRRNRPEPSEPRFILDAAYGEPS
jgi:hypothetical protein